MRPRDSRSIALAFAIGLSGLAMKGRADAPIVTDNPSAAAQAAATARPAIQLAAAAAGAGLAQLGAAPAQKQSPWQFTLSERLRVEDWNWWPTPKANGAYTFVGSQLRFGLVHRTPREEFTIELEQPTLANLPTKAIASAPQGQLGHGASYFAASGSQVASLFVKQAYFRYRPTGTPAQSLRVGRFEYSDGAELAATDPALAWLKRNRIQERLIGPFGFSHVGRSFDGAEYAVNRPNQNITLFGAFPTRGVFDLNGMDTLTDVKVASLSLTRAMPRKSGAGEARIFAIYYEDDRTGALKTDNRPALARAADKGAIRITTLGGHYLRTRNIGSGRADGLLWFAGQFGDWGAQSHGAYAVAAEAGYQFGKGPWSPWLRAGYYLGSGDGNPSNSQHGTFFPILPTPRPYARYPFYNESNLQDLFVQAILRSAPRQGSPAGTPPIWTIRTDAHALTLADPNDLWYAGGGAFQNSTFGYQGRPSGGNRNLALLLDASIDYQASRNLGLTLYTAYANGGNVISGSYTSRDSLYGYAEATYRY